MKKFCVRLFWSVVNPVRRLYWFIVRPCTRGVKVVVEHEGKILLVRLNYAHREWTIPGGDVGRRESYEAAGRREIEEECGIALGDLERVGEYESRKEYKRDTVVCFRAFVSSPDFRIDNLEIAEAGWFLASALPHPRRSTVEKVLRMAGISV